MSDKKITRGIIAERADYKSDLKRIKCDTLKHVIYRILIGSELSAKDVDFVLGCVKEEIHKSPLTHSLAYAELDKAIENGEETCNSLSIQAEARKIANMILEWGGGIE
jgi:hypothetical protein